MSDMTCRVFEARLNIRPFKVRKIFEDLLRRHSAGKQFKHMAYCDSHTANGWFTAADVRYNGDAIKHTGILNEPEKNTTLNGLNRRPYYPELKPLKRFSSYPPDL